MSRAQLPLPFPFGVCCLPGQCAHVLNDFKYILPFICSNLSLYSSETHTWSPLSWQIHAGWSTSSQLESKVKELEIDIEHEITEAEGEQASREQYIKEWKYTRYTMLDLLNGSNQESWKLKQLSSRVPTSPLWNLFPAKIIHLIKSPCSFLTFFSSFAICSLTYTNFTHIKHRHFILTQLCPQTLYQYWKAHGKTPRWKLSSKSLLTVF